MRAPMRSRRRSKSAGELSHVQVRFDVLRTAYASIRIPGTQPESTNAPDLEPINGSNSADSPDSNVLIGLDALLQVLQSANASSVVSTPPPDSFDFSRSSAHVSETAVQVAATALNQLSQQEAPDTHYPFAGMILSVCLLLPTLYIFPFTICFASTVPRFWEPNDAIRTPTPLSQSKNYNFPAFLLLRQIFGSLDISHYPSAMF
jgi:hypothetical protein